MLEQTREAFIRHAKLCAPNEACGLVLIENGAEVYFPCANIAKDKVVNFTICPESYLAAEKRGEILYVVHSHPNRGPMPSQADLVSCETSNLTWFIYSIAWNKWHTLKPTGYKAPLVGRSFSYGILDCFSLIRDYYKDELGIEIPNFNRLESEEDRESLYEKYMEIGGFKRVFDLKKNDLLIMRLGTKHACHGAIYLGDNLILHHLRNRLSSRDIYGEYYRKCTKLICRYEGQG